MAEKQQFISNRTPRNRTQHTTSSRLLYSLLIGAAVAFLLILVEVLALWLLNPGHLLGNGVDRLVAFVTLPFIAIILLEFLLCILVASLAVRPLALFAYLRAVHATQAEHF